MKTVREENISIDEETYQLASEVLELARERGVTIGCAESCTGGLVAGALTAVPGSSDIFKGGIVSYWEQVKENVLGVDKTIIDQYGVVSTQCAQGMAYGASQVLECDYAVSTTGIAGPGGALPGKPVGTVCFAVSGPDGVSDAITCEGSTRETVRGFAVITALKLLKQRLSAAQK